MRFRMTCRKLIPIGLMSASTLGLAQSGLTLNDERAPWPRWQTRVSVSAAAPTESGLHGIAAGAGPALSARLLGDYYFSGVGFGDDQISGGLRATSGLLLGSRAAPWGFGNSGPGRAGGLNAGSSADVAAGDEGIGTPYVGVGYTGLSLRGGWGFSADIGLVANGGSGLRVGRTLLNMQSLDDAVRDLRLSPMLQVGASYSF